MLGDATVLHSFRQFGVLHFGAAVVIAAMTVAAVHWRRSIDDEAARRRFDRGLGFLTLIIWGVNQALELWPSRFELKRSLPIHVCDFSLLFGGLALAFGHRIWHIMLYYWGLGLSTQAVFTPELQDGLASLTFWIFWIPHSLIVLVGVYDLVAVRFRPGWKDYGWAVVTLLGYLAFAVTVDVWLGVNYGYVGNSEPNDPSVIDFLGPWPFRLVKLVSAIAVVLALMTWPWTISARRRTRLAAIEPA